MFIHFLRSKDITLMARRSLVHLRNMEFRKTQTDWERHHVRGEGRSLCQKDQKSSFPLNTSKGNVF